MPLAHILELSAEFFYFVQVTYLNPYFTWDPLSARDSVSARDPFMVPNPSVPGRLPGGSFHVFLTTI